LLSRADETFYGGAAGGGKTDLALGLAIECHQKSIIFRREYPQLKDVVDRGDELLAPLQVRYNSQRTRWELPGGRIVELGAVDHRRDLGKYQGRPHDLFVFDEVAHFPLKWVRWLAAWTRSTDENQHTRLLMCGNPPQTAEGEWIIRVFAPWLDPLHPHPAEPGELRWFVVIDDQDIEVGGPEPVRHHGETIVPKSRTFIPARLDDNPFLRDTEYRTVLQGLPEVQKRQLLDGDFTVRAADDDWQVIPTAWVDAAQERWRKGRRPALALRCSGLDVSRGGDDDTVLARLYHEWFEVDVWPGRSVEDGPKAARLALNAMLDDQPAPCFVDVIGYGASAYDYLNHQSDIDAHAVNVGTASTARDKTGKFGFANLRSEIYWRLREALDPQSDHELALPPDRRVKADLCAAHYEVQKSGIKVESKDRIKKRLGFSPDYGDAIMLAWYGVSAPRITFGFV